MLLVVDWLVPGAAPMEESKNEEVTAQGHSNRAELPSGQAHIQKAAFSSMVDWLAGWLLDANGGPLEMRREQIQRGNRRKRTPERR